jgi:alpha-glucoside transport system permease protein
LADAAITAEPPIQAAPPPGAPRRFARYRVGALFLAPALIVLAVWVLYPTIYTILRSLFGVSGFGHFVGLDNYKTLFTTSRLTTAIKNNAIWVAIVPAFVTALGLMFAVLTERVKWTTAFKTIVFLPMAISALATGVTWRIMYQQDPHLGAINALGRVFVDAFKTPGVLPNAAPSTSSLQGTSSTGLVLRTQLRPGGVALLGLTAIPPTSVPHSATQAVAPTAKPGQVVGVVWRDFKPGGGVPGKVETGELGLPGVTVELRAASGHTVGSTKTSPNGDFDFSGVPPGSYRTAISASTFAAPWGGISWLGPGLITLAMIIAYIWIWAGFSMIVIGAGLSAMPRDVLEAARTDGATEWQVFRRVTVPLLWPVITVVLVTMLINVLKLFDLVIVLAPGSSQDAGNLIALAMWRESFGGVNDFGVGAAIAVLLFVLVIPILALNIRNFRREA